MQTSHRKVPGTLDCPVITSIFVLGQINYLLAFILIFFLLIVCDNNVSLLGLKTGGQTKTKKRKINQILGQTGMEISIFLTFS